jgi:PAS domain S-box-containing protein
MNKRFAKIHTIYAAYATGNFKRRIKLSPDLDEVDALFSGLHMVGQELDAVTISRDYFNQIFNSVSDMVLVLSRQGRIKDFNRSAERQLGYPEGTLTDKPVNFLTGEKRSGFFREIKSQLSMGVAGRLRPRSFQAADGKLLPVELTMAYLEGPGHGKGGSILITARDITERITAENKMLRAVIDTQEQVRLRLARDVHDSIGQQLSGIKFLVSAAEKISTDPELRSQLQKTNQWLVGVLAELRNVCFNLMPKTLEDFGLVQGLRELAGRIGPADKVSLQVICPFPLPFLSQALEIDLFRVIQEFISNAVRHGRASCIRIELRPGPSGIGVRLTDNGKGFDPTSVAGTGMGLGNMQSRIKSHNGLFRMTSQPGLTELQISIPLGANHHEEP